LFSAVICWQLRALFLDETILKLVTSLARLFAGSYSALLQYLEKDIDSVDVQLWKRLADPVLVHDAFSSFTWLLFCLPLPFPANGAPFTALVHLFYLVSIVQVLIAILICEYAGIFNFFRRFFGYALTVKDCLR